MDRLRKAITDIKQRDVENTLEDIESFKERNYRLKKSQDEFRGDDLRKVADIPMALYNKLPESVKKNSVEFEKWLRRHPEFWIVEEL